jgi:hypothetical protein
VALVFAATTYACDKTDAAAAGKSGCPKACADKVLAGLPAMTYKVGELETPCFKTATDKASDDAPLQYMVDGQTYDCRGKATATLVSLLETQAEQMMTVQYAVGGKSVYCPMEAAALAKANGGKVAYRLAGLDFESKEKASDAANTIREAVAKLAGTSESGATGTPGCKPGCGAKAATVAGGEKKGCAWSKAKTVAGSDKKGDGASKATAVAVVEKKGCGSSKAKTVAGGEKKGCVCPKGKTVAGGDKKGCCPKAKTVAGGSDIPDCCAEVEKAFTAVQDKLRVIVETGAKALAS